VSLEPSGQVISLLPEKVDELLYSERHEMTITLEDKRRVRGDVYREPELLKGIDTAQPLHRIARTDERPSPESLEPTGCQIFPDQLSGDTLTFKPRRGGNTPGRQVGH
jgi:hypothetical protein